MSGRAESSEDTTGMGCASSAGRLPPDPGRHRQGGRSHDLYATSVAPEGPLVGRSDAAVAFSRPPGAGHRDVHELRRRQPDRAAEPRGTCAGLPGDPPAERPHPGPGQSPASAAGRREPARRHARRRRPPRDSGRRHHRPPDGTARARPVRRDRAVSARKRIPPGPGTFGGSRPGRRVAKSIRGGELVEPRARTTRRARAGRAAAADVGPPRKQPDVARVHAAGVPRHGAGVTQRGVRSTWRGAGVTWDYAERPNWYVGDRSGTLTTGSRPGAGGAAAGHFADASASALSAAWGSSAAARLAKIGSLVINCSRSRWACSFSPLSERICAM